MIHLLNAIGFAFAAYCWNRNGWVNTACAFGAVALAVTNASLAYPFVSRFIAP